jgi:tripartite-type tricarboxylate transporter receptor subunit TctC
LTPFSAWQLITKAKGLTMKLWQWVSVIIGLTVSAWCGAADSIADYPHKAIRFIVPFPAGSATDTVGRVVAHAMSEALQQPITVENKPGANGILGAESVKLAAPDGYTLLVTTSTIQAANVHLYKKLSYDPIKDFSPIGKVGDTGFVLLVAQDFPARDLKEFLAFVREHPREVSYGQGSSGSWVSAAMLAEMAQLEVLNVPYKGIPPALNDLMGGQIQFVFADVGNASAQIAGGRLRGLGITTRQSASKVPNVPPISKTLKNYGVDAWFGLVAPAQLPFEIQNKLSTTLMMVLKNPALRDKLQQAGVELAPLDAKAFGKTIQSEINKWGQWVKIADIHPE